MGPSVWRLIWMVVASAVVCAAAQEDECPGCTSTEGPCAVQLNDEDRRLGGAGSMVLANLRQKQVGDAGRRLAAAPFTGSPPAEITLASLVLPMSADFLNEAALLQAVVDEINADPNLFPNTTVKGVVASEGTDIKSMLDGADDVHIRAKACVSVGLLTGPRQSLMASVAKVRNTNHGFYMDMTLGTMPRFNEFGTSFGILGWSTIIARFLDMVLSYDPPMDRFALILPESFAPMADRFDVEQKIRGISIVYKMIYDYRRVDVDAGFEDADSYAKQIIDGVAASKANLIFQCFCSTNNKYFRAQLLRHAIAADLMRPGFQWFTHYPSVIKFKEPWLYQAEYADIWPYLDYYQVLDQGDYEPPNYDYTTSVTESQAPEWSDGVLKPKIQAVIDAFDMTRADRGYGTLSMLNCSDPIQSTFTGCGAAARPGQDAQRAKKWDAIKHIAWTLHELIYTDGHYDFCDVDAAGVRTGDPQLFLDKMQTRDLVGFSGLNRWQYINVVGGQVLTLPPSFMLTSWIPTFARTGGLYGATKVCVMHVDRFSKESDPYSVKVLRRDFFTGKPVTEIRWMGNVTTLPLTWYHDMCGKGYRIEMSRADKKCMACPTGEFNAPLDNVDKCESISNYSCPAGTYLVDAMASGSGLESPCMPCAEGTFSVGGNVHSCELCPVGTFQPSKGSPSCMSCLDAMQHTAPFTTKYPGSISSMACVCPADTYKDGPLCKPCPTGMICEIGSDMSDLEKWPQVEPGFMTLAGAPLTVYECQAEQNCPGGAMATCDANRDNSQVACPNCLDGYYEDDDKQCVPCNGGSGAWPLILAVLGIACGLTVVTLVITRGLYMRSQSMFTLAIVAALLFMNLQALAALGMLSVEWFDPIAGLFKGSSIVSFNVKLLRFGCISRPSAVGSYLIQQMMVPAAMVWCTIVLCAKKYIPVQALRVPNTNIRQELIASVGTIVSILFIGILLSTLGPLNCYVHPDGNGSSMRSAPEILCNGQGDHASMVAAAIIVLMLIPVPFMVLVFAVTRKYRSAMSPDDRKAMMNQFRFLFFRFTPQAYYYASVIYLRSICMALVPVVIWSDSGMQTFLMTLIFAGFSLHSAYVKPWRSAVCNILDISLGLCMMMMLVAGSLAIKQTGSTAPLKVLSVVMLVGGLLLMGTALTYAAMHALRRVPPFNFFLCHVKGEAGAQARLLRCLLAAKGASIFIETDTLTDLDQMFDVIKSKVGACIVYLTQNTLKRSWCCGELVCASLTKCPIMRVETPSFVRPTDEQIKALEEYVSLDACPLGNYGIAIKDIQLAFEKLLSVTIPTFVVSMARRGTYRTKAIANELLAVGATVSEEKPPQIERGSVLISASEDHPEAVAASGLLRVMLQNMQAEHVSRTGEKKREVQFVCTVDHFEDEVIMSDASAIIFVLSGTSLQSAREVNLMTAAVGIQQKTEGLVIIATHLPDFSFPHLASLTKEKAALDIFFKSMSIQLPIYAAQDILTIQVKTIWNCLLGAGKEGPPTGFLDKMMGLSRSNTGLSTNSGKESIGERTKVLAAMESAQQKDESYDLDI